MQDYEEAALRELENATAEHLGWLKRVHAALLFRTELNAVPVAIPQILEDWVDAPETSMTIVSERRQAFTALRNARRHLLRCGARLASQVAAGKEVDSAQYHAFMGSAECFARELRRLDNMLRQAMAETDPLTGVNNRLGMMRDLDREWQRSIRTGQPCCVALADLDHFKCINDTYGHQAGDRVLRVAARFFVRRLRPYDRVYRYGGEEFLFILPNTELATAEKVLNRLRTVMARLPIRLKEGHVLRITASIGITEISSPEDSPTAALTRADRAVYVAKNTGRNRVSVEALAAEKELESQAGNRVPTYPAGLLQPSDHPNLHR